MHRLLAVLAAVLVAAVPVGAVAATPGPAATAPANAGAHGTVAPTFDRPGNGTANATNDTLAPGEQLAAVVSVQAAEIDGTVRERTFGVRVARAATNDSRARVVADQVSDVRSRLETIERRRETIEERRENGTITEGRYRAEVTALSARAANLRRLANASERTASGLPADVLRANGVNVTAIQRLRAAAGNLTGPEVAAIARSIAGRDVGRPVSPGPVVRPGPGDVPTRPGNVTRDRNRTNGSGEQVRTALEATTSAVEQTRTLLNRTRESAGSAADDALARAAANLSAAEDDLAAARRALDAGDVGAAEDDLAAARDHIENARDALDAARDAGDDGGY